MSHFAQVINGIVQQVIVAEQDVINSGLFGPSSQWIQTSYNTRGNKHYNPNTGVEDTSPATPALRGNYAGIGYIYDAIHDVFYPPKPHPTWVISAASNWVWVPPLPMPSDAGTGTPPKQYVWNETKQEWVVAPPKKA